MIKKEHDKLYYSKWPRKGIEYQSKKDVPLPKDLPQNFGGLGADLDSDEVLYKKAVNIRVKEFSSNLRDVNKKRTERWRSVSNVNSSNNQLSKKENWRDRANEFANKIPKPQPKSKNYGKLRLDDQKENRIPPSGRGGNKGWGKNRGKTASPTGKRK